VYGLLRDGLPAAGRLIERRFDRRPYERSPGLPNDLRVHRSERDDRPRDHAYKLTQRLEDQLRELLLYDPQDLANAF